MSVRVVHVHAGQRGLFGAHIRGRANQHFKSRKKRFVRQALIGRCLRNSKIDDFGQRCSSASVANQNIGQLDVSMDDSLLVRMLDRFATLMNSSSRSLVANDFFGRSIR